MLRQDQIANGTFPRAVYVNLSLTMTNFSVFRLVEGSYTNDDTIVNIVFIQPLKVLFLVFRPDVANMTSTIMLKVKSNGARLHATTPCITGFQKQSTSTCTTCRFTRSTPAKPVGRAGPSLRH